MLLDQEGLEVDPVDRLEGDTPLHKAVRFINDLPKGDWEAAKAMADLLLDAGADPRYVTVYIPHRITRYEGPRCLGVSGLTLAQDTQQSQAQAPRAGGPKEHGSAKYTAKGRVRNDGWERCSQRRRR